MSDTNDVGLSDRLARAVYEWALGRTIDGLTHHWPLSVGIGPNDPENWPAKHPAKRQKRTVATIHNPDGPVVSVVQSPTTGKPTIYVHAYGVKVVRDHDV